MLRCSAGCGPSIPRRVTRPPAWSCASNGQLDYGQVRDRQTGQLQALTDASLLWQLFRALIEGALEGLVQDLGRKVIQEITDAIDQTVEAFLNDALQISPEQVSAHLKAEELGYL